MKIKLKKEAVGLKLSWLISDDEVREYEAIKFSKGYGGVYTYLNRATLFGKFKKKSIYLVEILDKNKGVIQDFGLTKESFDYLKKILKLRWERGDMHESTKIS